MAENRHADVKRNPEQQGYKRWDIQAALVSGRRTRWAVEGTGANRVFHRFQSDGKGEYHWNGSTAGVTKKALPAPSNYRTCRLAYATVRAEGIIMSDLSLSAMGEHAGRLRGQGTTESSIDSNPMGTANITGMDQLPASGATGNPEPSSWQTFPRAFAVIECK